MGILNITPDSFSDGGQLCGASGVDLAAVLDRAAAMVDQGVDLLDVGGESTRPGATPVSVQEEMDRVMPVVEALRRRFDRVISVDTGSAAIIREACRLGAGFINDVRALQRPGALEAAAEAQVPVCLMHMAGEPSTMQAEPRYVDVIADVKDFLERRVTRCIEAGIPRCRILIDPGFGFGKSPDHNLVLLNRLHVFVETGLPVVVGVSRKSMIGAVTGRGIEGRLAGSLALAALATLEGAAILRVHNVVETRDVVDVISAVRREKIK